MNQTRTPLTERQQAVYDWIVERTLAGRPVGVRDIALHFGYGNNGANGHVNALRRKGYLSERSEGKARANDLRPAVHELRIARVEDGLEIRTTGPVRIDQFSFSLAVRNAGIKLAA